MASTYYENYMGDCVVRDDGENRYLKMLSNPAKERLVSKDNELAYGGEAFGYFYELKAISKSEYDGFGVDWTWAEDSDAHVPTKE